MESPVEKSPDDMLTGDKGVHSNANKTFVSCHFITCAGEMQKKMPNKVGDV